MPSSLGGVAAAAAVGGVAWTTPPHFGQTCGVVPASAGDPGISPQTHALVGPVPKFPPSLIALHSGRTGVNILYINLTKILEHLQD